MEKIYKCPKCGEKENLHFNYDYNQQHRPIKDVLCNDCGEVFEGNMPVDVFIAKAVSEYPELEGTMNLCEEIIQKRTGKMTEEEWQAAERAQTGNKQENCCTPIGQIKRYVDCIGCDRKPKQETLEEAAKDWYNKEGLMKPSKVEVRAWVKGAKWQEERMYSEEEVKSILMKIDRFLRADLDIWFEQFKKVSMIEKSDNQLKYERIHDECREIFRGDRALDQKLEEFRRYLADYLGEEEDNGTIRTLLIIGKPFKENPIVKATLDILAERLRTRLGVDRI
jgi:hypothetical protein